MKLPLKTTILFSTMFIGVFVAFSTFFSVGNVYGLEVDVNAYIDIDPYSTIEIDNENSEVGLTRHITVRITDRNSSPLVSREVYLYSDITNGAHFTQPLLTDSNGYAYGTVKFDFPGVYLIKAKDTTFENDINLTVTTTAYVFPIPTPVLKSEPYYTKGTSNTIKWSDVVGLDSAYKYQVQVSTNSDFTSVLQTSPMDSTTSYTFHNLSDSQMYFYRVKAMNSGNAYSSWSESVFSVQDSVPPKITIISPPELTPVGDSGNIIFKFSAIDSLSLKSVKLYCSDSRGDYDCGSLESVGSNYTGIIPLENLDSGLLRRLEGEYVFCIVAYDQAGNVSRNCDFRIQLDDHIDIDIPIFTEVINYIFKGTSDLLKAIDYSVASYLVNLKTLTLSIVGILLLMLSTLLSFFALVGSLGLLPIILKSLLFAIYRFFGLSKHGVPCGVVYDAQSKKPIRYAYVEAYDGDNRLYLRSITDSEGIFMGTFDTGRYRLVVKRSGYLFPSVIVKKSTDEQYNKVYRGDIVIVSKRNPMNISIPMDPINIMDAIERRGYRKIRLIHFVKHINFLVSVLGLLVAFHAFERDINFFNLLLLLLYIPAFAIYLKSTIRINIGMRWSNIEKM